MKGRTKTYEEKRMLMERILAIWASSKCSSLRLGQLLDNAHPTGGALFYIEDRDLAEAVEAFEERNR